MVRVQNKRSKIKVSIPIARPVLCWLAHVAIWLLWMTSAASLLRRCCSLVQWIPLKPCVGSNEIHKKIHADNLEYLCQGIEHLFESYCSVALCIGGFYVERKNNRGKVSAKNIGVIEVFEPLSLQVVMAIDSPIREFFTTETCEISYYVQKYRYSFYIIIKLLVFFILYVEHKLLVQNFCTISFIKCRNAVKT